MKLAFVGAFIAGLLASNNAERVGDVFRVQRNEARGQRGSAIDEYANYLSYWSSSNFGTPCACAPIYDAKGLQITATESSSINCNKSINGQIYPGDLVTCSANTPIVEYGPAGTTPKLRTFPGTNNLITYPEDFTPDGGSLNWFFYYRTVSGGTFSSNRGTSPLNTSTPDLITLPATKWDAGGEFAVMMMDGGCGNTITNRVFSMFVKGADAGGTITMFTTRDAGWNSNDCAYSGDYWTRCSVKAAVDGTAGRNKPAFGNASFTGFYQDGGWQQDRPAQNILVWGAMCEAGNGGGEGPYTTGTTNSITYNVTLPSAITVTSVSMSAKIQAPPLVLSSGYSSGGFGMTNSWPDTTPNLEMYWYPTSFGSYNPALLSNGAVLTGSQYGGGIGGVTDGGYQTLAMWATPTYSGISTPTATAQDGGALSSQAGITAFGIEPGGGLVMTYGWWYDLCFSADPTLCR